MKFTLSWLKDYLETGASLEEISTRLTALGLEVEGMDDPAAKLKDFIVAEITEAAPHPNASKLQVCKVNDGKDARQIVCGAANARAGLKVVLAREGVFIPGSGITIKKTKIRDVESNGMLCSSEELGLPGESSGIIELPTNAVPGTPAAPALGANDPVIEIAITPNRADCLGVYGVARDLAAAGVGALKPLPLFSSPTPNPQPPIPITLATPHCPYFIGCPISGVKNGPSPEWLQAKLTAIGLRPISALVDITNYFTHAFARPLHVFDAAKLSGGITVRAARAGEKLKALDGKEYALDENTTVIADDAKALAIGGIIGGEESGCTEATTDVFLEVAYFKPVNIAQTGRRLEILSDARYRFERGVDAGFMPHAAQLAVQMILDLCGGTPGALVIAGANPHTPRQIPFAPEAVKTLSGVEVPATECDAILSALGFTRHEAQATHYTTPSWRNDVEGTADLVEEILRVKGYDAIPATPLPRPARAAAPLTPAQKRAAQARRLLAGRGMLEACSYSFIALHEAQTFGGGAEALQLQNPISEELAVMRPSLIPALLNAARRNHHRSIPNVALFEVGVQFTGTAPDQQAMAASGIRTGQAAESGYAHGLYTRKERPRDAFDAKADALALLESLGVNTASLTIASTAPAWYHPGRSGTLTLGGKIALAHFGELHPGVAKRFDLEAVPVALFEVLLDAIPLPRAKSKAKPMLTLSEFQPVTRDFAFVVDEGVTAAQVEKALSGAAKELVQEVRIFDVYSGKGMEPGKKSVAVSVTLQAMDRTLSEADISAASSAMVSAAASAFGGVLRG